jgi:DNA-binding response OmpR family regulator
MDPGTRVADLTPRVRAKILVVDDNEAACRGLAEFLERSGFDVVCAGSFNEGRAALKEEEPDVLIADVRLGEFNGLQLLATAPRSMPAIVVTGYPDPVIEADARGMGAEYLVKPIMPGALAALVRKKLEERDRAAFATARRWERKPVAGRVPAKIGNTPARLVDVSYGGVRLELQRQPEPPGSLTVNLPASGFSVNVDVVWTMRVGDERWMCGGTVAQDTAAAAWHGLVDAVA